MLDIQGQPIHWPTIQSKMCWQAFIINRPWARALKSSLSGRIHDEGCLKGAKEKRALKAVGAIGIILLIAAIVGTAILKEMITSYMGVIVIAMGAQFAMTGLKGFFT